MFRERKARVMGVTRAAGKTGAKVLSTPSILQKNPLCQASADLLRRFFDAHAHDDPEADDLARRYRRSWRFARGASALIDQAIRNEERYAALARKYSRQAENARAIRAALESAFVPGEERGE